MRVPHAHRARVDKEKITGYLLSLANPMGKSKARFFLRFGFTAEKWQDFAIALRSHAATCKVVKVSETKWGSRYSVEGVINTPDKQNPRVVTVWQIGLEDDRPRLITAFPSRRQG